VGTCVGARYREGAVRHVAVVGARVGERHFLASLDRFLICVGPSPRCFVPMSDTQSTVTGRTWRHFSVFWPFMLAGAVGPCVAENPWHELLDAFPVAPIACEVGALTAADTSSDDGGSDTASASGWKSDAGGDAARTAYVDEPLAAGQELPGPDLVNTPRYLQVFGSMPIHDAVLLTFCRAARLGGALFGAIVASTTSLTEEQINSMEEAASALCVDCFQTLYSLTNTTKLYRLVQHLGAELRG